MDLSAPQSLGPIQNDVQAILDRMQAENTLQRIRDRDHTVWKDDPAEISNRMGWLDSPTGMPAHLDEIRSVIAAARRDGCTHALLLGMGGSSLAPEVFRLTFGVTDGFLDLSVLDSTDPGAVLAATRSLNPARTLYIPATKSGGTVETFSFLKHCYRRAVEALGIEAAGDHFVAITDPGSGLADMADRLGFRHIFLNDPDIGGRYSALSFFGLVAAGAVGIDLDKLLERARKTASRSDAGALLGAAMGAGALQGRDKVTLVLSPPIAHFGSWAEQLIAESTGKEGKGILPVDGEPLHPPSAYGSDRLFVYLRLAGDTTHDTAIDELAQAGHPVLRVELDDLYDLGGQLLEWELATIVAGYCLQINPFDQPDVEAAKILARQMVQTYHQQGRLPGLEADLCEGALSLYGAINGDTLGEAINAFLAQGEKNRSYISLQAYIQTTRETDALLGTLRLALIKKTGLATTVGYGPRFLHSTGQLHKGDAGCGLFIQFTADPSEDIDIPNEPDSSTSSMTFGVLIAAQALGDRQALIDTGRQVLRINLGSDVRGGLQQLLQVMEG
jgi:glucose-6-phosphate isomerase